MKNLIKRLLFVTLIGILMVSCEKEELNNPSISDNSVPPTKSEILPKQKNLSVEDQLAIYFDQLEENQILNANMFSGELEVIIVIGIPPEETPQKKFSDNYFGRIHAAKYAAEIIDSGGCAKAWKKDGYIYVVNC